jgi:O-antigen ligase
VRRRCGGRAHALGAVDARIAARPPRPVSRSLAVGAAGATLLVVGIAFVVAGGPGYVHRQYDTFVQRKEPEETGGDLRTRLTDPSSNGRIDEWRVAIDAWKAERLHGTGAGTYQIEWNRERPDSTIVYDGHSLYAEILGELGIVGLLLVLGALLTLLAAAAVRIRGPDRALFAAAFAFLSCGACGPAWTGIGRCRS